MYQQVHEHVLLKIIYKSGNAFPYVFELLARGGIIGGHGLVLRRRASFFLSFFVSVPALHRGKEKHTRIILWFDLMGGRPNKLAVA